MDEVEQEGKGMKGIIAAFALCISIATPALGQTRPEFPKLTGRVVDTANEIPDDKEALLERDLEAFEKQSGHQFVIVTIPDLKGYPKEDYAYQLGRHWGIGRKGVDDGILMLRSPGDGKPGSGKTFISIGYGLEGVLTDAQTSVVYNQIMRPILTGETGTAIDDLPKPQRAAPAIIAGAAEIMRIAAITPEQRAEDERRLAAERAREWAAFKDGVANFFGWVISLLAIGGVTFGIWWKATAKSRAEKKRIAAEIAAQQERERAERKRLRDIEDARIAEERRQQRIAAEQARAQMLAMMSDEDRETFLAEERRQAEAAERRRRAEEARRQAECERLRKIEEAEEAQRAKIREEERRRNRSNDTGFGGGFGGGDNDGGGFSGGGGSFGGGGAGGDD